MGIYPRIMVNIPKQHKSIGKAVDKIAKRCNLSKSKVIVAILIDFLKRTNEIKVTCSYDEKYRYIKKMIKESEHSDKSELIEV